MAVIKKSTKNKFWEGYGEKGTLYTIGGNGKQYIGSLKKIEPQCDLTVPLMGTWPEKIITQRDTWTPLYIEHYLQQSGHGSNLGVHWQRKG